MDLYTSFQTGLLDLMTNYNIMFYYYMLFLSAMVIVLTIKKAIIEAGVNIIFLISGIGMLILARNYHSASDIEIQMNIFMIYMLVSLPLIIIGKKTEKRQFKFIDDLFDKTK